MHLISSGGGESGGFQQYTDWLTKNKIKWKGGQKMRMPRQQQQNQKKKRNNKTRQQKDWHLNQYLNVK